MMLTALKVSEGFLLENWQQIRCMKRSCLRAPLCMLSTNSLCSLTLRGEIWWLSRLGASTSLLIDSDKPWLESREQTHPLGLFVLCWVWWGGTAASCFVSCMWSGMASCSRRCWWVQVLGKESRRGIKDSGWAGFPASDDDCFHTLTLWHLYTLFSKHVHFSHVPPSRLLVHAVLNLSASVYCRTETQCMDKRGKMGPFLQLWDLFSEQE